MKVAICGHRGFIGSYLYANLPRTEYELISLSRTDEITTESLADIDAVIYLGGIVGHIPCSQSTMDRVFQENVEDIMRLAYNMREHSLLIYASTAALYEGFGANAPTETALLYTQLFDNYMNSLYYREQNIKTVANICSVGLRLGTVIGIAPTQKHTSIHINMLRDAVLHGKIRVNGAHISRSILWNRDLLDAVHAILSTHRNAMPTERHRIYNMCSFNCTVSKIANEIACKTGCRVLYEDTRTKDLGFSMNCGAFGADYPGFQFKGTNGLLVDELIQNMKHVCYSNRYLLPVADEAQCRVCKSAKYMAILHDFGTQPNANHYIPTSNPNGELEQYPLRLDVCRNCYHTQISYTIPPKEVFSNYVYFSGTSNTMREFFRQFAEKTVNKKPHGTVLEIACNDGSLLDQYKALGWTTYGYDPAQNIYEVSSAKGHNITVGFWGTDDPVPAYPKLDMIVAQNVCAHVPDPVQFLKRCREYMDDDTILYIQTSQSEMIERGQFDTAYHEHLSFFTVRSMNIAANMAGLCITDVEKVDVHGISYVFHLKTKTAVNITEHPIYQYEKEIGLYDDLLYYVFVEKIRECQEWLSTELANFHNSGIRIAGYGAAAKGMTVLNSIPKQPIKYIADDSPYKWGVYATSHKYLICSPDEVCLDDNIPTLYIVFAWNFIEEIKRRIMARRGSSPTYFMVYYPKRAIYYHNGKGAEYLLYEEMDTRYNKDAVSNPNILITHFYNEESLLTDWIRHHAPLFSCAVLIDHNSTDNSRKIIEREAPSTWNTVRTGVPFCAALTDQEVSGYENSFSNTHWRLALTTTEFLYTVGLRQKSNPIFQNMGDYRAIKFPSVSVIDSEPTKPPSRIYPIVRQKNSFYFQTAKNRTRILTEEEDRYINNHYNRFMHNIRDFQNPYWLGRHHFKHPAKSQNTPILKMLYAPYPEFYARKLQIKHRMTEQNKRDRWGFQHLMEYDELRDDYNKKAGLPLINMTNISDQMEYYDEFIRNTDKNKSQLWSGLYYNMYEPKNTNWAI